MTNNKTDSTFSKGAWTSDEDRTLTLCIQKHGPRRWKSLALRSGLKRCGKSCRLRWLNYLRPDIKRGNISDAEEDLILRLHRLLGNRWSLIAGRIPGRTDNEIKNYWNAHLRKKACSLMDKLPAPTSTTPQLKQDNQHVVDDDAKTLMKTSTSKLLDDDEMSSDEDDEPVNFSTKGIYGLDWVKKILELEEDDP